MSRVYHRKSKGHTDFVPQNWEQTGLSWRFARRVVSGSALLFCLFQPGIGVPGCQAQTSPDRVTELMVKTLPDHPRLLARSDRFESLKQQNDPVSRQLKRIISQQAESLLTADTIVYPSKGFKFGAVRTVQGRILTLALHYRLTGDRRFLNRARQELLQLAALPDWAPNHFLDVGEASLAAGIGLDWLYADLTATDRDLIAQSIVKNALLPSLDVAEEPASWVRGDFNWNQVCHAGLTVGALAIAEREPALSRRIINRAIQNLPYAGAVYATDGAYPEGPSYWSYGTTFHVLLIEALRSSLGDSFGLERFPGFLKTAEYTLQIVGPSGQDFNYSDYHAEQLNEPVMLWFARECRQPALATGEVRNIETLADQITQPGKNALHANRHLPLELLWWTPSSMSSGQKAGQAPALPLHWTARGVLPLAVMRSAWNDSLATFVAIKGGTPNHSHAHMDVGGFVLESDGVRWAIDLGTEKYDNMRAAKIDLWNYSQTSTRWTTFRVGPEGHNILRFDDERQQIDGKADLTKLPDNQVGNVVDLSPVYAGQVARANRTVRLATDRSVWINDEWTTTQRPVTASWQWLTQATVTQRPEGLLLQQNGKTLALRIQASGPYSVAVEDVSAARNQQDSPNPGVSRIRIQLATPAGSTGKLAVRAIPGTAIHK